MKYDDAPYGLLVHHRDVVVPQDVHVLEALAKVRPMEQKDACLEDLVLGDADCLLQSEVWRLDANEILVPYPSPEEPSAGVLWTKFEILRSL